MLEIGCGVSRLSLSLLQRMLLRRQEEASGFHRRACNFVATDVSLMCIEQNRMRDECFAASIPAAVGSLRYEPLDMLNQNSSASRRNLYEVILDKGTLDTFLFRSKRTNKRSASHPPLLTSLLKNVHRLLRSSCGAKYVTVSPRRKIKAVRDFRGFASVRRIKIETDSLAGDAVLVRGNSERAARPTSAVYLYECTKNDSFDSDSDLPYSAESGADGDSTCRRCGMTFADFRGKSGARGQGEIALQRRWKNHGIHCK